MSEKTPIEADTKARRIAEEEEASRKLEALAGVGEDATEEEFIAGLKDRYSKNEIVKPLSPDATRGTVARGEPGLDE